MGDYGGIVTFTNIQEESLCSIRAVYQEVGDTSVMGGDCQKLLLHGAPALEEWQHFEMAEGIKEVDCVRIQANLHRWDSQRWGLHVLTCADGTSL